MTEKRYESDAEKQKAYRERQRERDKAELGEAWLAFEEAEAEKAQGSDTSTGSSRAPDEALTSRSPGPTEPATVPEEGQPQPTSSGRSPAEAGLKAYVSAQLAQTKAYAESFRAAEKKTPQALQQRYGRAGAYARWRFAAYANGEVTSL